MTSGERMVWAAEFVRKRAAGSEAMDAAYSASCAVHALRELRDASCGDDLVDDMLGNGADR